MNHGVVRIMHDSENIRGLGRRGVCVCVGGAPKMNEPWLQCL